MPRERGLPITEWREADAELVHHVETLLAGSIGAASARVMVASVVEEEPLGIDEVMDILDETSQVIAYSRELERKSQELEAATSELRGANRRLRELDRLKDDFVSTVTHELRTPLTSMRAFAEILLDNPELPRAERERFLRIVVEEIERLSRLINQVLDLAKIESGRAEWDIAAVDLAEVIEESATAAAQLLAERKAELQVSVPEEVPSVPADRDRVKQVLLNLLSNAAKFCDEERGRVAVELAVEDGVVRVDVRDNGPGIDPEDQEVIFDRFRQGGPDDDRAPGGHRAGAADQPRDHQAAWAASCGWTAPRGRARRSRSCSRGRGTVAGGEVMASKVLIVDDEPNIVLSLEFLMKQQGYETRVARDGDEALAEVEGFRPDLVLLDVMLPRRDGFEVCQRLRADGWSELKILMLTAKGRDVEIEKGLALGADGYVTKPFSTAELVARVAGMLERAR